MMHRILLGLFAALLIWGCGKQPDVMEAVKVNESELPDFLGNLEQVTTYPFYKAEYEGDYGFAAYLDTGAYPDLALASAAVDAFACSCFFANGADPVYGRNFDWYENPALFLFTLPPDGFRSVSMVDISYLGYDQEQTPMQDPEGLRYAPYYPFDGMNEHGLVVGMMAVPHGEGENDPAKVTLGSLEIIRLMLDHARDVEEALALLKDYNVDFGSVPVHYLIADRAGNSAIVEYLVNEMVIIKSDTPYQVSTNFIIDEVRPNGSNSPSGRYNTLTAALADANGTVDVEGAMRLLDDVSQTGGETATRWSVVYDMQTLSVHIAIDRNFHQIFAFSMQ